MIRLLRLMAPYIWVGFWLWVFMAIAGKALEEAPLYVSIPIIVVVVAFSYAWIRELSPKVGKGK